MRLPGPVVRRLSRIDDAASAAAVVSTAAVAAASVVAPLLLDMAPWALLPSIVITASRQQALFVLAHDAAHGRLFGHRALNDAVGSACGALVGLSMHSYRVVHRLHHNHLYDTRRDPDLPIHAGYPRGGAYLARKLLVDLTGATWVKTQRYFFGHANATRPLEDTSERLRAAARSDRRVVVGAQACMLAAAAASGHLVEYAVLWLLPAATVLQQLLRLRSICEHGAVRDLSSPLTAARTNTGPAALMWFLMPHNVGYHTAHHVHPSIPHANLPAAHAEMAARGLLRGAEVRDVRDTLRIVFGPAAHPGRDCSRA